VGKRALNKKLGTLLTQSILIGIAFLLVGAVIIYFIVTRMLNPLNTLIQGVQTLGKGDFNERVPVETDDEIGKLAMAFNQMSESLMKREVEKKRLEAQLSHSQRMEAIGTLAGGIAHDFNNILGAISGYTELAMAKAPRESKISQYLTQIYLSSRRAVDLVRQILEFSRETEQSLRPIAISALVRETLKMMRATIPTSIAIHEDIRSERDTVLCDPTRIHQVIMNLCTNAYQAIGDRPGEIEVTVETTEISEESELPVHGLDPGAYIRLTVRDNGSGMEPAVMDRIFDPFFTTKKTGEGTGLGLSVVHGIVKNYRGKITVESHDGQGSTFHVYLPLAPGTQSEPIGEDTAPTIGGSERILLVDDEEFLAAMTQEILEELGYHVLAMTDSTEALAVFRAGPEKFDLLITDQTMPKLSGTDLAQEVILVRPDIPVILCTGFSRAVDAKQAQAMGIREFIMKPITKYQIAGAIRRVLNSTP
jgi:signal transduction histidine kinase/ActR/RegA family two-component response regulator